MTPPPPVASRNLLAYGPASGSGLTATVNEDGSLHLAGDGKHYNTISNEPFTITTAGTYSCCVIARNGSTVDADIMPVLTAISDGTSETDG